VWPGAKNVLHWSIEDPSFLPGSEETRLEAFRATRDDLRRRIDALVEAFPRRHPRRSDEELLARGAPILDDVMRLHGFRWEKSAPAESGGRATHAGRYARPGRALESPGPLRGPHRDVGGRQAAHAASRVHGAARRRRGDALPRRLEGPPRRVRRLRADVARFGGPFLSGDGIREFRDWADASRPAGSPGPSRL
jgi:hypothetical protein